MEGKHTRNPEQRPVPLGQQGLTTGPRKWGVASAQEALGAACEGIVVGAGSGEEGTW